MKPLAMWQDWQNRVKEHLPLFCLHPLYVAQDVAPEAYEKMAPFFQESCPIQLPGKTLGEEYGATVVETQAFGRVTRMWMDSMVEVNFLARHVPLRLMHVLDIGAGYGRLAAVMVGEVASYTCVDSVEISKFVCEYFTMKHAPDVMVLSPEQLPDWNHPFSLAINIHSWSECSLESIEEWLAILKQKGVLYLFTVPHDDNYLSWGGGPFRPLIERDYGLVEEVKIGMHNNPHSLWKRR